MSVVYRDVTPRVSLAALRVQMTPARFKATASVTLEHRGSRCTVAVDTAPGDGCVATRRWFRCPTCGGRANVLGFVDEGWRCRRCTPWRARNRQRLHAGLAQLNPGEVRR